ncbi:MAG: tetratricopeptide repeat protein [Candidatus Sumerlaeaceae bacterium]
MKLLPLALFITVASLLHHTTFAEDISAAKAAFEARNYAGAAAAAEQVLSSGTAQEKPEAAALLLKAHRNLPQHEEVLANYDQCLTAALSTAFESQVKLERAKSLHDNARDTTAALAAYNEILSTYPNDAYSAPGALYGIGMLQAGALKIPASARQTYDRVITEFPASHVAGSAVVGKARLAVPLKDITALEQAEAALNGIQAKPNIRQAVQFERGEYNAKVRGPGARRHAAREYQKTFKDFPELAQSDIGAMAKLRAADNFPMDDFNQSLVLYKEVLDNYPKLENALREWAALNHATMLYQLEREQEAAAALQSLIEQNPSSKIKSAAQQLLTGITDPNTTEAMVALFDRAIRFERSGRHYDLLFWDMQRIITKSREQEYQDYVTNQQVSSELRADMRYRLAYAYFHSGYGEEAMDLAGKILEEDSPSLNTRAHCLYLRGFLLGRISQWTEAAQVMKQVIDADPGFAILRNAYLEYSRALDLSGDRLGAALALEELGIRYPLSYENEQANIRRRHFATRDRTLAVQVEAMRPALIAKFKPVGKDASLLQTGIAWTPPIGSYPAAPSAETSYASAVIEPRIGGAE